MSEKFAFSRHGAFEQHAAHLSRMSFRPIGTTCPIGFRLARIARLASNSRLWQLPDWDNLPDSKTVVRVVVKARLPNSKETPDCPIGSHSDTYSRFPDWKKLSDWPIGRECPIARSAETARLDSHRHVQLTDCMHCVLARWLADC